LNVVEDEGRRALHMKSANDSSTLNKDIRGKVRLKETPILEWDWKSIVLPKAGNSCKKSTDDQAGQVFVVWPRFPEAVRSRIIGYVWDTTQPAGTICKSEKTGTVTYVVVHSGPADLNKWLTEQRNVVDDFKKIYGDAPDDPAVLSLGVGSNDTGSTAGWMMGAVRFKSRCPPLPPDFPPRSAREHDFAHTPPAENATMVSGGFSLTRGDGTMAARPARRGAWVLVVLLLGGALFISVIVVAARVPVSQLRAASCSALASVVSLDHLLSSCSGPARASRELAEGHAAAHRRAFREALGHYRTAAAAAPDLA